MSNAMLLVAGMFCFSLTVLGMAMTMQEFRNAEKAKRK
jgi:hypothetical protein